MSFPGLLNNTVSIKRLSLSGADDGMGGWDGTESYTVTHRRVKCRFNALPKREQVIAYNKKEVFANWYCYMEYRSGIQEQDRLYMRDGREFEVKLLMDWDEAKNYLKLAVLEIERNQ